MKKRSLLLVGIFIIFLTFYNFFPKYIFPVFSTKKEKKIVVIDAGHGGNDPGKVSADGTQEKDINLEIAKYLQDYLIAQDYTVYLTRDSDCGLYDPSASNKKTSDLQHRIQFFKDKNASYVISIHQNSYSDTIQHGAQSFYHTGSTSGKRLAESIQTALLKIDPGNTRSAKSSDSYYLLKNSSMPAVIIECGFLSNPEETALLKDANYQKKIAYAISLGLCAYDRTSIK